jgi:DNA-binding transcriptional regulator YiaG
MQPSELKRIRRRLGVTQAALAALVGVTGNTIARWERGEVPIGPVAARLLRMLTATPATTDNPRVPQKRKTARKRKTAKGR